MSEKSKMLQIYLSLGKQKISNKNIAQLLLKNVKNFNLIWFSYLYTFILF